MLTAEISRTALARPPEDRSELARPPVESVAESASVAEAVDAGIRRIEDMANGWVAGLTEQEYRAALQ